MLHAMLKYIYSFVRKIEQCSSYTLTMINSGYPMLVTVFLKLYFLEVVLLMIYLHFRKESKIYHYKIFHKKVCVAI